MRRIGTLNSEAEAQTLADYLFTQKIETKVSGSGAAWDIWLLDEDQLDRGRSELLAFQAAPRDPRYQTAAKAAQVQRDAELQAFMKAARQDIDLRRHWERPLWQQMPVTFLLVGLALVITLVTEFGGNEQITAALQIEATYILEYPNSQIAFSRPMTSLPEVRRGELWRLVTPIFIHSSPWHVIPNCLLALLLGGKIERERGSWRLLFGILAIAIISNLAEYGAAGARFGGLSGVVYGMFGYVFVKGRWDPDSGLQLSQQATLLMLIWLFLCTTGAVGQIANVCHFVGLAVGLFWAAIEVLARRARA